MAVDLLLGKGGLFLGPDPGLHAEPFGLAGKGGPLLRRHAEPVGSRLLVKERDPEILLCREDHAPNIGPSL